jgi:hypothetical protein
MKGDAKRYQARGEVQQWNVQKESEAKTIQELDKKYGALIDHDAPLYRGDFWIDAHVRWFNDARSMVAKFAKEKDWLKNLSDEDFNVPQKRDYLEMCGQFNGRLLLCDLAPHVGKMRQAVEYVTARMREIDEQRESHGLPPLRDGGGRIVKEVLQPQERESREPLTTNSQHDPRVPIR